MVIRLIKRTRASKSEMEARQAGLYNIVWAGMPMTVRQVFYQATVIGLVDKTEAGSPTARGGSGSRAPSHARNFASAWSVELAAIQRHLPADQFHVLKEAERSEREGLMALVGQIGGHHHG